MAYAIIEKAYKGDKAILVNDEYVMTAIYEITAVLDSSDDLTALGTATWTPGSVAIVADGGAVYMLSPSGEWGTLSEGTPSDAEETDGE